MKAGRKGKRNEKKARLAERVPSLKEKRRHRKQVRTGGRRFRKVEKEGGEDIATYYSGKESALEKNRKDWGTPASHQPKDRR